jgi:histidinol-phosphate aminotransferase
MIVLDEAYGEFAPAGTLLAFDAGRTNLLRMRTFSKAYGLAGARVGYVLGEATNIAAFNRIRNHFGISNVAQAAAIAALADGEHLASSLAAVRAALEDTAGIARRHGLTPLCQRPQTSSPWIAGAMAPMRRRYWMGWRSGVCSCASRWWRG